jgi:hypothetical protein
MFFPSFFQQRIVVIKGVSECTIGEAPDTLEQCHDRRQHGMETTLCDWRLSSLGRPGG